MTKEQDTEWEQLPVSTFTFVSAYNYCPFQVFLTILFFFWFQNLFVWQAAIPIGEYAAVTLLMFFGLKSIKDAWDIPSNQVKTGEESSNELDEFAEAEELVKEQVTDFH